MDSNSIINILPEFVANQIAAGEVVNRPASAVKELLENAVDAGSTEIELYTVDAGRTLIQVIDNGCGMNAEDAQRCFLPHATSKLSSAEDLHHIRTMGFRGEAWSRTFISTRRRGGSSSKARRWNTATSKRSSTESHWRTRKSAFPSIAIIRKSTFWNRAISKNELSS